MSDLKLFGETIIGLFQVAYEKLGPLAVLNVTLILAIVLFVTVDAIGSSLLAIAYAFFGSVAQVFGKEIRPTIDTTPFWQYALFLFLGFFACIFIVKKHISGKLW